MNGGTAAVSSTTERTATADVRTMTAAQARYHLTQARQRVATLVGMLDDEKAQAAALRREIARLRKLLRIVSDAVSDCDGRSG